MYTDYWHLDCPPFTDEHRLEAFVPTRNSTQVVGRLRFALGQGGGVAGLYGPPGVGKTLILKLLLTEFVEARWLAAYLPNPCCSCRELLAAFDPSLAAELPPGVSGMAELRQFLAGQASVERPVLLVVDDVQATRNPDFLELLRTLLNIENNGKKALSLLLTGQPTMEKRLAAASGFDTQLAVKAILAPMDEDEAKLYILARLKAAGSKHGVFTRQAADLVVELTQGNPRQINRLCELSLVVGFGLEAKKIDPSIIEMAAADLDMLPGEETPFFPWSQIVGTARREPDAEEETPQEEDILASLPVEPEPAKT